MRHHIVYPTKEHPDCEGEAYVDDESDPDVVFIHYRNFRKPGMRRHLTEVVELDKKTGRKRFAVDAPPAIKAS